VSGKQGFRFQERTQRRDGLDSTIFDKPRPNSFWMPDQVRHDDFGHYNESIYIHLQVTFQIDLAASAVNSLADILSLTPDT